MNNMTSAVNTQEYPANYLLNADKYPHLKNKVEGFVNYDGTIGLKLNIDSSYHVYLKDHVFGSDSFVPGTMVMELFFEAALFYCEYYMKIDVKDLKPAQLIDFSLLRALAMPPGKALNVEFIFKEVTKKDNTIECSIEIISDRINQSNIVIGTRINATSKVVLSSVLPQPSQWSIPDLGYTYYQVSKSQYYTDYFPSLGPLFQSSCSHFAVSDNMTYYVGEYDCLDKEKGYISGQESNFLTSPLGNDSCLQNAVFFARVIDRNGRLPIGGKKIEFYKKHPLSGKVKVFVECTSINHQDMVSNIYSFDSDGIIFHAEEFTVRDAPYEGVVEDSEFDKMLKENKAEPFSW
jgi:hypothetical protein